MLVGRHTYRNMHQEWASTSPLGTPTCSFTCHVSLIRFLFRINLNVLVSGCWLTDRYQAQLIVLLLLWYRYLACTEEGYIHKCSCSYNEQFLETYTGHNARLMAVKMYNMVLTSIYIQGPVYRVTWSPFVPTLFLSCSADWSVKLWSQDSTTPLHSFHAAQVTTFKLLILMRHHNHNNIIVARNPYLMCVGHLRIPGYLAVSAKDELRYGIWSTTCEF